MKAHVRLSIPRGGFLYPMMRELMRSLRGVQFLSEPLDVPFALFEESRSL